MEFLALVGMWASLVGVLMAWMAVDHFAERNK